MGELGIDHYEGRSYLGFHHHCAIVTAAHGSLTLERLDQIASGRPDPPSGMLQERSVREARGVIEQRHGALSSRVVIEQAKGVLAERAQIGVDVGFARLRAYARAHNRRLSDVAHELIDGRLDVAALTAPARDASASHR